MKSRLIASLALGALVVFGTTGCAMLSTQATTLEYSPADGVNVLAGVAASLDVSHQHNTTSVVEGEYQEFLYDGDIE